MPAIGPSAFAPSSNNPGEAVGAVSSESRSALCAVCLRQQSCQECRERAAPKGGSFRELEEFSYGALHIRPASVVESLSPQLGPGLSAPMVTFDQPVPPLGLSLSPSAAT